MNPVIAQSAWIAPTATVIGDVQIGANASVWYGAVIRGDADRIVIGARSNIQDLSVVHVDVGMPCIIGDEVTVGHRAIIHACTLADGAMIGMGAIVLNGAVVCNGAVVGAGALVPEGFIVPAGTLVVGSPCRVVRPVDDALSSRVQATWRHYVDRIAVPDPGGDEEKGQLRGGYR
jgi:carbonic anhydrase/acetyltransferase-like protein (isoleucine patch superfamily)